MHVRNNSAIKGKQTSNLKSWICYRKILASQGSSVRYKLASATTGDQVSGRLIFIDKLISTNPEIVVYGLDLRHINIELERIPINQLSTPKNKINYLPTIQIFDNIQMNKKIFGIDLENTSFKKKNSSPNISVWEIEASAWD